LVTGGLLTGGVDAEDDVGPAGGLDGDPSLPGGRPPGEPGFVVVVLPVVVVVVLTVVVVVDVVEVSTVVVVSVASQWSSLPFAFP
jgi:hypothetical protein